jgi:methionyl-tRNA formyltransferase
MHPTLLPEGRGRGPIPWTIIKGLKQSGVTAFELRGEPDTGDIFAVRAYEITPFETASTLYQKARIAHVELMQNIVADIQLGRLKGKPQDEGNATYWPVRRPEDGLIHDALSLIEIEKLVRACTRPYPGAFLVEDGRKIIIWSGEIVRSDETAIKFRSLVRDDLYYRPSEFEIINEASVTL